MPSYSIPATLYAGPPAQQVSVRATWSDSWAAVTGLTCAGYNSVSNPSIASAQLRYRYGIGKRPSESEYGVVARSSLVGYYVRVEVTGSPNWYGIITDVADERTGAQIDGGGARVATGVQHYTAQGLELLLDLTKVDRSYIYAEDGGGNPEPVAINRGIPFNGGSGLTGDSPLSRNRHQTLIDGSAGVFVSEFSPTVGDVNYWTAAQLISYLLAFFSPVDKDGAVNVPFALGLTYSLNWDTPRIESHDRSVKSIIDQLIDRRRGYGYTLSIDETEEPDLISLNVFTHSPTTIALSNGKSLIANGHKYTMDFDLAANIRRSTVRTSALQEYDQIRVVGERLGAVATFSFNDETLVKDWSDDQQTTYDSNAERRTEDLQTRVYSWFTVPDEWDGLVGDGEGGATMNAFTVLNESGFPGPIPGTSRPFWQPGLKFENYVPLLTDHDHSGNKIGSYATNGDQPQTSPSEFLPPIVLIGIPTTQASGIDDEIGVYRHVERLQQSNDLSWSCNVRVREDRMGVILEVVGQPQHYLADGTFVPNNSADAIAASQGLDYHDLIVTAYIQSDDYLAVAVPDDDDVEAGDVKRLLTLHVPGAHEDWIAGNTVVGLEDGALKKTLASGWQRIRSDRDRLNDIAQLAYTWYATPRRTLDLSFRFIWGGEGGEAQVGHLITSIGAAETAEAINTVITEMSWDLEQGLTTIRTQFANLDILNL